MNDIRQTAAQEVFAPLCQNNPFDSQKDSFASKQKSLSMVEEMNTVGHRNNNSDVICIEKDVDLPTKKIRKRSNSSGRVRLSSTGNFVVSSPNQISKPKDKKSATMT
jgi:hypothetical protein